MLAFIKYFSIIICSFYIYYKLLNFSRPQNHYAYFLFGIPSLSLGAVLLDIICPQGTDLILILFSIFFLSENKKKGKKVKKAVGVTFK